MRGGSGLDVTNEQVRICSVHVAYEAGPARYQTYLEVEDGLRFERRSSAVG